MRCLQSPVVLVSGLSVLLSNLVSNVPAVLLFKPLMEVMPQQELAWLALAMSSTLAGNLTVLGSVANLIVVENARRARDGAELPGIPEGRRPAHRAHDDRRGRLVGSGPLLSDQEQPFHRHHPRCRAEPSFGDRRIEELVVFVEQPPIAQQDDRDGAEARLPRRSGT